MLFAKKDTLVGLDLGSRAVKAAEVVETKNGLKLKRFGMAPLPAGTIEDGSIADPDTAAEVIRELFKESHIKEKNVAVSIGGYSVIVKKIQVQARSEEQLQETIHFEAEQYIPFDISDVNLDFQILGESEAGSNQMSVFLVAAKKDMVNDYVNLVSLAGLNPCIVDVEAFALQNIFEANYETDEENVALVDIGASKTSLNILKGGSSVFMRDVALGCTQINQKIMSRLNCSEDEAEKIKLGADTGRLPADELEQAVSEVVTDWCTEIRRALDFFATNYPDDRIRRILLSGGGAHVEDFRRRIAAEAGIAVETLNPLKKFGWDDKRFDAEFIRHIAPQAAIAMGLALRRVDDK